MGAAMLAEGMITRKQYRFAVRDQMTLTPGRLYTQIKQPYFFTYVSEELQRVYGANTVREGGYANASIAIDGRAARARSVAPAARWLCARPNASSLKTLNTNGGTCP